MYGNHYLAGSYCPGQGLLVKVCWLLNHTTLANANPALSALTSHATVSYLGTMSNECRPVLHALLLHLLMLSPDKITLLSNTAYYMPFDYRF